MIDFQELLSRRAYSLNTAKISEEANILPTTSNVQHTHSVYLPSQLVLSAALTGEC